MKHRIETFTFIVGSLIASILPCPITAAETGVADAQRHAADASYRDGDFDKALRELEPLLDEEATYERPDERTHVLAARILHARGEDHFRHARIAQSIADFDRELLFQPNRRSEHWQLGIALYYAGEYQKGAEQFMRHQNVNPQDVENAVWHFLCQVRSPKGSVESARKSLISVTDDQRVPMAQIQQLFAGAATPEEVLRVGADAGGLAKFYADLYVGLYHEALGRAEESLAQIERAAKNPVAKDSYMGDVARVHVAMRSNQKPSASTSRGQNAGDEKPRKILFLVGNPSHGYGAHDHWAGCKLLAKSLDDSGLPIETEVYRYGWPKDAKVFDDVDCIVIYADGGGGHIVNEHLEEMDTLAKKGVGIVCLHYAVEVPKGPVGDKFLDWIGGYFEADWSVNPHWTANFATLPDHPITFGVKPFRINDEWYYHMRFRKDMQGVTPILTDLPPPDSLSRPNGTHSGNPHVRAAIARKEKQHMAWAVEREDGGRGFGFTGAHVHWNWADPNFRKLVLNAIVWSAKVDVPREGVVDQQKTLADMESNPDEDVPSDFNRESIRKEFSLPPDAK